MITITLTPEEVDHANDVGARRAEQALSIDAREHYPQPTPDMIENHQLGARGELAFAKWSGFSWDAYVGPTPSARGTPGEHTWRDVGPFGVRTSRAWRLIVRPERDPPDKVVYGIVQLRPWSQADLVLLGWMAVHDAVSGYPAQGHPWPFISVPAHALTSALVAPGSGRPIGPGQTLRDAIGS